MTRTQEQLLRRQEMATSAYRIVKDAEFSRESRAGSRVGLHTAEAFWDGKHTVHCGPSATGVLQASLWPKKRKQKSRPNTQKKRAERAKAPLAWHETNHSRAGGTCRSRADRDNTKLQIAITRVRGGDQHIADFNIRGFGPSRASLHPKDRNVLPWTFCCCGMFHREL